MLRVDPALAFDHRVRRLSVNAELLFYRGLFLAGLMFKEPLLLTMQQFEILIYDLDQVDSYGNLEAVTKADVGGLVSELVRAGLVDRIYGDADGSMVFDESIATFCNPTKANLHAGESKTASKTGDSESKPQKQIDPALSEKRRAAGRKGGRRPKRPEIPAVFSLNSSHDEGAA